MLTLERLKEFLIYDPQTGHFIRRVSPSQKFKAGTIAGGTKTDKNGYRAIGIDGRHYRAHRLAWLYMTGHWPYGVIDHKNGEVDDNRFDNLRDTTTQGNSQNLSRQRNNSSGLLGVTWDKHEDKWKAHIQVDGRHYHLGLYSDKNVAHAAYCAAKQRLHQFQPIPR